MSRMSPYGPSQKVPPPRPDVASPPKSRHGHRLSSHLRRQHTHQIRHEANAGTSLPALNYSCGSRARASPVPRAMHIPCAREPYRRAAPPTPHPPRNKAAQQVRGFQNPCPLPHTSACTRHPVCVHSRIQNQWVPPTSRSSPKEKVRSRIVPAIAGGTHST
jgi:hypothetical protein